MKRIYIAAGALLLGTSAFAWAPSSMPVAHSDKVPVAAVDPGKAPDVELVAKSNDLPKVAYQTAKPENASASWIADDSSLDKSIKPDSLAKWNASPTDSGMGGPIEETSGAAPVAAVADYPPCRPGPGDDHCIQLYERGVRAELASWNASHDTALAQAETADTLTGSGAGVGTGMGGPYEPVDAAQMNGDGSVDTALGETATDEGLASADATWTATPAAAGSEYTGMGGPLEAVDYPPCRPGPGDDRCIQLYERGVTGR